MTTKQIAETRTYKIYRHALPNGKIYIGTTSAEKLYDRFKYGNGYDNQPFGAAIIEYGWSQIQTTILEEVVGTYKDATLVEAYWVKRSIDEGYEVYNKHYAGGEKEYKYNIKGCTIVELNKWFPTMQAAANYIGVTRAAISSALKENRACKGWTLAYGNLTKGEEEND